MNRSILLGLCVVAGHFFTAGRAEAQHMKVKMSMGQGFHHGHKLKFAGIAPFAPFGFAAVQPTFVQPGAGAQGLGLLDLIRLIGRLPQNPGGGSPNLSGRLDDIDARVSKLSNRIDDLTTRVVALESKNEEYRRARILLEQHDDVLKEHHRTLTAHHSSLLEMGRTLSLQNEFLQSELRRDRSIRPEAVRQPEPPRSAVPPPETIPPPTPKAPPAPASGGAFGDDRDARK